MTGYLQTKFSKLVNNTFIFLSSLLIVLSELKLSFIILKRILAFKLLSSLQSNKAHRVKYVYEIVPSGLSSKWKGYLLRHFFIKLLGLESSSKSFV